ncbi:hypothetical protein ACFSIL_42525, partial [Streptosporangium lutulentum]
MPNPAPRSEHSNLSEQLPLDIPPPPAALPAPGAPGPPLVPFPLGPLPVIDPLEPLQPPGLVPLPGMPPIAPESPITPAEPDEVDQMVQWYGPALVAYCRIWLPDPVAAADAAGHALIVARHHGDHLPASHLIRPWLYAVARLRCLAEPHPASVTGELTALSADPAAPAPAPRRDADELDMLSARLASDALCGLDRDDREFVELALRHQMDLTHTAAILGRPQDDVEHATTAAIDLMQAWANAVHLGRTGRSLCEVVTPLAQAWDNNPRRETRTKIRMHVTRCPTCSKAFNLRVSAEELLSHLPIPMLSALQQEHLIHPTLPPFPLELHWGPDGFPLQSDLTADHTEVEEAPVFSAGLRAANNRGFWDGDPDAEDARWWRDDPSPEDSPATGQAPSPPRLIDVTLAEGLQRLRRSLPAPSLGGAGRALRTLALTAACLLIAILLYVSLFDQPTPMRSSNTTTGAVGTVHEALNAPAEPLLQPSPPPPPTAALPELTPTPTPTPTARSPRAHRAPT